MTEDDKEFAFEFLRAAGFTFLVLGVFFAFVLLLSGPIEKNHQKFEVVDEYKGCDVVRYNKPEEGHYTYFLDCRTPAPGNTLN